MSGYGNAITNGELTNQMKGMVEKRFKEILTKVPPVERPIPILPLEKQEIFWEMHKNQKQ